MMATNSPRPHEVAVAAIRAVLADALEVERVEINHPYSPARSYTAGRIDGLSAALVLLDAAPSLDAARASARKQVQP